MRTLGAIAIFVALTTGTAAAQTVVTYDREAARGSARIGYGGRGVDVAGGLDSPQFGDIIRFRIDAGHGSWQGINSRGDEPHVTRLAASALLFFRRSYDRHIQGYAGFGVGAYFPHRAGMDTQLGRRLTLGMEGTRDPWTIGVEFEIDLTGGKVPNELVPAGRLGIALRKAF